MGGIWLSSDFHLNHDREFIWKARGFGSVREMNEAIVANWNAAVAPDDDAYILGDCMLGADMKDGLNYLRRLNGRIRIAIGNHDTDERVAAYRGLPNVVEVAFGFRLRHRRRVYILTHYPTIVGLGGGMTANLYGHTHQRECFYDGRPSMFHVGVDAHGCRPLELEEIRERIQRQKEACDAGQHVQEKDKGQGEPCTHRN